MSAVPRPWEDSAPLPPPLPSLAAVALLAQFHPACLPAMISQPPTGFNPLTTSAAQLAEYGFPPRPSGGAALTMQTTADDSHGCVGALLQSLVDDARFFHP